LIAEFEAEKKNKSLLINEIELLKQQIHNYEKEIKKVEKLSGAIDNMKQKSAEQSKTIEALNNEIKNYKKRLYDENSMFGDIHLIEKQEIENDFLSREKELIIREKELITERDSLKNANKELLEKISLLEIEITKAPIPIPQANTLSDKEKTKNELINKINVFLSKMERRV